MLSSKASEKCIELIERERFGNMASVTYDRKKLDISEVPLNKVIRWTKSESGKKITPRVRTQEFNLGLATRAILKAVAVYNTGSSDPASQMQPTLDRKKLTFEIAYISPSMKFYFRREGKAQCHGCPRVVHQKSQRQDRGDRDQGKEELSAGVRQNPQRLTRRHAKKKQ
jgi:hypothetical protein